MLSDPLLTEHLTNHRPPVPAFEIVGKTVFNNSILARPMRDHY
jgi:hypothetical protein